VTDQPSEQRELKHEHSDIGSYDGIILPAHLLNLHGVAVKLGLADRFYREVHRDLHRRGQFASVRLDDELVAESAEPAPELSPLETLVLSTLFGLAPEGRTTTQLAEQLVQPHYEVQKVLNALWQRELVTRSAEGWTVNPSAEHIRVELGSDGFVVDPPAEQLPAILEEVEADPAPDLQPGPTHPHVDYLEQRAARYDEGDVWLEISRGGLTVAEAFELGYRTAIHDLRQHTSEPMIESGVVMPDGTHVPDKE
jgi:hypothetical protein